MKFVFGSLVLAGLAMSVAAPGRADESDGVTPSAVVASSTSARASRNVGDPGRGGAVFELRCARCHGPDGSGGGSAPNVRGVSTGEVFEAVREGEGGMPRFNDISPRVARDISAFLRGATPPPASTPAAATTLSASAKPPTYKSPIKAIFSQSCLPCHKGSRAAAGIRLDSYANVSANATRAFAAVQAGRMPLGGSLSASQIQSISDWIAGGKRKK